MLLSPLSPPFHRKEHEGRQSSAGAVGKAPFPDATMRDSGRRPSTRMGLLFSADQAWARQRARDEDTMAIDSGRTVPTLPGLPSTPVRRHQAVGQRAPFQSLPRPPLTELTQSASPGVGGQG